MTSSNPQLRLNGARHALAVVAGFTLFYIIYFSPAIFTNHLLAPGDGLTEYSPLFLMKQRFWNDLNMCGYPYICDPQCETWYPVGWLFRDLLHNWNAYIMLFYILSSSFAYGLAFSETKSKTAALVAGIVFGSNGYAMSTTGHSTINQCNMWFPLVIWSFVELRKKFTAGWLGHGSTAGWLSVAVLSVACLILAGQLQMVAFLMVSVSFWICGQSLLVEKNRLLFFLKLVFATAFGIGIAMISLLPAVEFSTLGFLRMSMSSKDLLTFNYPFEIFHFFFPCLFGLMKGSPYGFDYFGPHDLQSVSCYLGLCVPILAFVGAFATWRSRNTKIWVFYCVTMLLLALGDTTPVGKLVYFVPIYSHFRVPTRHFPEFCLAVSLLAAFGTAQIMQHTVSKKLFARCCGAVVGIVLILAYPAVVVLQMVRQYLKLPDAGSGWLNPAVLVPIVICLVQLPILGFFLARPASRASRIALLALVTLDLASFGWFAQWHYGSPAAAEFDPPAHAARYRELLGQHLQRYVTLRGNCGTRDELPPNLSALWEMPSASGYENFVTDRYYNFFVMPDGGFILGDWASPENRALDVASIRFVFAPKADVRFPLPPESARWKKVDEIGEALVFENMRAAPRAWLAQRALTLKQSDVLSAIRNSSIAGFDPLETALVEEPIALKPQEMDKTASVLVTRYSPERMELDSQCANPSFLVTSDTFHPGWKASVDGTPTRVVRTNYIFRGVPLPAGKHHIVFSFEPFSLFVGAIISVASLAGFAFALLLIRRRQSSMSAGNNVSEDASG